MISGISEKEMVMACLRCGCYDFLVKPIAAITIPETRVAIGAAGHYPHYNSNRQLHSLIVVHITDAAQKSGCLGVADVFHAMGF